MKYNEKGFTLIEMLLVLFIVLLFSAIAFKFTIQYSEKRVIEQVITQLQLDILTAQAKAIEEQQSVQIKFSVDNRYVMFNEFGTIYVERNLPEEIKFNILSNLQRIWFTSLGEVVGFGTIRFNTSEGEKVLIINIHKGRIRYEK